MLDLRGKWYAVFGVANENSICWAIAKRLREQGSYITLISHPKMGERVTRLAATIGIYEVLTCDVGVPNDVERCFCELRGFGRTFDGIVHGIAFSDKEELRGRFIDTTPSNFDSTLRISCYSLIEIARRSMELMPEGGSIVALTFDGSQGPYPHYNVMGVAKAALEAAVKYAAFDLGEYNIRVNAVAASPENTLSARGIAHFRVIGDWAEGMSLLGRRATLDEIANEVAYLLSPASSGATGQIRYVDCGSSVPRLPPVRNAAKIHGAMARILEITGREKDHE